MGDRAFSGEETHLSLGKLFKNESLVNFVHSLDRNPDILREHLLACEHGADIAQGSIHQLYGSLILTEHMEQSV